ncbi:hypothetical protein [Methylobacterium sp. MA0201]
MPPRIGGTAIEAAKLASAVIVLFAIPAVVGPMRGPRPARPM